jgi:hypothetical protein
VIIVILLLAKRVCPYDTTAARALLIVQAIANLIELFEYDRSFNSPRNVRS